jgi:integrase
MIKNKEAEKIRLCLSTQDQLIWDLCVETGLRISDALNIKARDIPILGRPIMYIQEGKTGKHKIIELSNTLRNRLRLLWSPERDYYAFRSPRSPYKHINRSTYHRRLQSACRASRIACSAHSTRKLYAYNIYQKTGSLQAVQEALNHKYVTTTARYLDIDIDALIKSAIVT